MITAGFIEVIGYVGAIVNTASALPQLLKTFNTKNVSSLSLTFLWTWLVGCLLLLIYSSFIHFTIPIFINYSLNIIFPALLIIMYYKYK